MEKEMGALANLIYRFSSRGILWPALYGVVFGINVLPFGTILSAVLGVVIGYVLILPIIGMFTPITYSIMMIVAVIMGRNAANPIWETVAIVLLVIHIFRTVSMIYLVKKYPEQTRALDAQYQRR